MKYFLAQCGLHGWLLVNADVAQRREDHYLQCNGHAIKADTRALPTYETDEVPTHTNGLTESQKDTLVRRSRKLA